MLYDCVIICFHLVFPWSAERLTETQWPPPSVPARTESHCWWGPPSGWDVGWAPSPSCPPPGRGRLRSPPPPPGRQRGGRECYHQPHTLSALLPFQFSETDFTFDTWVCGCLRLYPGLVIIIITSNRDVLNNQRSEVATLYIINITYKTNHETVLLLWRPLSFCFSNSQPRVTNISLAKWRQM